MKQMTFSKFVALFSWVVFTRNALQAADSSHSTTNLLFNGSSLAGWQITPFEGHSMARVQGGSIVVEKGDPLSGINYTNPVPLTNYEVCLEARKLDGDDFFCALTFPVAGTNCTLVLGGWGGSLVGISSIDELDASENLTAKTMDFTTGKWYEIRLRVAKDKIEAWLDSKQIVKFPIEDHRLGLRRGSINKSCPLGLATYQTKAEYRNIRILPVQ